RGGELAGRDDVLQRRAAGEREREEDNSDQLPHSPLPFVTVTSGATDSSLGSLTLISLTSGSAAAICTLAASVLVMCDHQPTATPAMAVAIAPCVIGSR